MIGPEVVRYRVEGGTDDMGNPVDAGAPVSLFGCAVYPRGASSESSGRDMTTVDGRTILIPEDEIAKKIPGGLKSTGEYEWAREPNVWRQAVGDPAPWYFLDGAPAGIQVNVRGSRS